MVGTKILACIFLSVAVVATAAALPRDRRSVSIEDLIVLRKPVRAALSPDGKWVAYSVQTPSLEENSYRYDLYVVAADGNSQPRRLSGGEVPSDLYVEVQNQSP